MRFFLLCVRVMIAGLDFDEGMLRASHSKFAKYSNVFCYQARIGSTKVHKTASQPLQEHVDVEADSNSAPPLHKLALQSKPLESVNEGADKADIERDWSPEKQKQDRISNRKPDDGIQNVRRILQRHHGLNMEAVTLVFVDVAGTASLAQLWPVLTAVRSGFQGARAVVVKSLELRTLQVALSRGSGLFEQLFPVGDAPDARSAADTTETSPTIFSHGTIAFAESAAACEASDSTCFSAGLAANACAYINYDFAFILVLVLLFRVIVS